MCKKKSMKMQVLLRWVDAFQTMGPPVAMNPTIIPDGAFSFSMTTNVSGEDLSGGSH
jgi:hypothetical protein